MTIPFGFQQYQQLGRSSPVATSSINLAPYTKSIGSFVHCDTTATVTRISGEDKILFYLPYSGAAYYEVSIPVGAVNFGKVVASNNDNAFAFSNGTDTVWVYTWDKVSPPVLAATLTQTGNGNFGASLHMQFYKLFVGNTNASGGGRVLSYDLPSLTPSTTYTPTSSDSLFGRAITSNDGNEVSILGSTKIWFYTKGNATALGSATPAGGGAINPVLVGYYDVYASAYYHCTSDSKYLHKYDGTTRSEVVTEDLESLGGSNFPAFTHGIYAGDHRIILYDVVTGGILEYAYVGGWSAANYSVPDLTMLSYDLNAGYLCTKSTYSQFLLDQFGAGNIRHPLTDAAYGAMSYRYSRQGLSAFSPSIAVTTNLLGQTEVINDYVNWSYVVWGASASKSISFPTGYYQVYANARFTHLAAAPLTGTSVDVYSMQTRSVTYSAAIPGTVDSLNIYGVSDSGDRVLCTAYSMTDYKWVMVLFNMVSGTSSIYVPSGDNYIIAGASSDLSIFVVSTSVAPKKTILVRSSDFTELCTVTNYCYRAAVSPYAATGISWDVSLTTARVINLFTGSYVDRTVPLNYYSPTAINETQQYVLLGPGETPHLIRISDWTTVFSYSAPVGYDNGGRQMSDVKYFSRPIVNDVHNASSW